MTSQHGRHRWKRLRVPAAGYCVGPAVLDPDGSVRFGNNVFLQKGRIDTRQGGWYFHRDSSSPRLSVKQSRGPRLVFKYTVMGWYERVSVSGRQGLTGWIQHHKRIILMVLLLAVLHCRCPSLLPIAILLMLLSGPTSAESFSRSVISGAPDEEFLDDDTTE